MMKLLAHIAAIAFLLAGITPLYAQENDFRTYAKHKAEYEAGGQSKTLASILLMSVAVGSNWYRTIAEGQGHKPLYCAPAKLAITADQYHSILVEFVENSEVEGIEERFPVQFLMVQALVETFPCSGAD